VVLIALFVGVVLIVAAIRNSQSDLFTAIGTDVPPFIVWAAAIVAIGAIGFVPGLKPISKGLLALVIVVLILQNYRQVIAGFQNAWKNPPPVAVDVGAAQKSTQQGAIGAGSDFRFGADGSGGFGSFLGAIGSGH
jgi:hypothetical protein